MNNILWKECLCEVKKNVTEQMFDTWFKPLSLNSYEDNVIIINVPNKFFKEWITLNYQKLLTGVLSSILNRNINISFTISSTLDNFTHAEKNEVSKDASSTEEVNKNKNNCTFKGTGLNPKYLFDNFVVGPSNQFAHAASVAVSKNPALTYNPLFLYGGVGLGKTHLMNAIGHQVLGKSPGKKINYITSEKFVNDLINSIQNNKMEMFRRKYRSLDVLLVDDIQFIAGKERTQVEFFHTFNSLYQEHKQIIISSDKFPKEISGLEERLRNRFECGLIADIEPPELETKVAILNKKSSENSFYLPPDVALYIANKIKSNIRELEGCLARLCAYCSLTGKDPDLDLTKNILKDIISENEIKIDIKTIQQTVSTFFDLKVSELKSKKRSKNITVPRQIAMFLCREMTNFSLPEIGKNFNGKDHTTVLHSYNKIDSLVKKDKEIASVIHQLKRQLNR